MLSEMDLLVSKSTVENCFLKNHLKDTLFKYISVNSLKCETWVFVILKENHEECETSDIQKLESICMSPLRTERYRINHNKWVENREASWREARSTSEFPVEDEETITISQLRFLCMKLRTIIPSFHSFMQKLQGRWKNSAHVGGT